MYCVSELVTSDKSQKKKVTWEKHKTTFVCQLWKHFLKIGGEKLEATSDHIFSPMTNWSLANRPTKRGLQEWDDTRRWFFRCSLLHDLPADVPSAFRLLPALLADLLDDSAASWRGWRADALTKMEHSWHARTRMSFPPFCTSVIPKIGPQVWGNPFSCSS